MEAKTSDLLIKVDWASLSFSFSHSLRLTPSPLSLSLSSASVSADDLRQSGMKTLEHVAVTVTITHPCRGNLEIELLCPSGMTSLIGARRAIDRYSVPLRLCY